MKSAMGGSSPGMGFSSGVPFGQSAPQSNQYQTERS